jgi:hypothetical protein
LSGSKSTACQGVPAAFPESLLQVASSDQPLSTRSKQGRRHLLHWPLRFDKVNLQRCSFAAHVCN